MSNPLDDLEDFAFRDAWFRMSDDDKREIPKSEREIYIARYRRLTSYVDDTIERFNRIEAKIEKVEAEVGRPEPTPSAVSSNLIKWPDLIGEKPPEFVWLLDHWLSWHPTLLAGRGGIGKSLLIQQVSTALACGAASWCAAREPLNVLYWACEDDVDQLWRREDLICRQMKIGFEHLDNLHIDARYGLENTLMASDFGKPMWTPTIEILRQQVNDLAIDVLALDNLGHTFGANENNRHDVTKFLNGIAGLVTERPFCPIFLGHPSKAMNSEYSGSTAWENAVRMRWYLDDKLPDQRPDSDSPPDPDYRILSKRKTNYTRLDYVQFKFEGGVLVPEQQENAEPGILKAMRHKRARSIVLAGIRQLAAVKIYGSDRTGRNYLPHLIVQNKLAEGYTKTELAEAMRTLIMDREIELADLGKNASRHQIWALKPIAQ